MNLHTAGQRRGVVAAPHAAAVEDGRAILAEGGNAIEAMIAMAASIAAVYPHMNHVGGDGFWLIREPSGRVRALMGAGRAGAKATLQLYRHAGHPQIPSRGPPDAPELRENRGEDCGAVERPDPGRHALQHAAADAGAGFADNARFV